MKYEKKTTWKELKVGDLVQFLGSGSYMAGSPVQPWWMSSDDLLLILGEHSALVEGRTQALHQRTGKIGFVFPWDLEKVS